MTTAHVASFVSMVPNKRGPVELGLLEIGREWVARGGRYSVYYLDLPEPWYAELLDEAGIGYGTVGTDTWHDDVKRLCDEVRPDVVHLHMHRHSMARALARRGIAVVRTEHSERPRRPLELGRRLVRWYQQRPLAGFTSVSRFLAEQTKRDFLVGDDRVTVIYNGCDLDRFRPRPDDKHRLRRELLSAAPDDLVVTTAAHLIPRKQQQLLIGAMPAVLERVPTARLVIAGDGPDREALHRLADELGVSERVTFLHDDNDVALIYAASDVGALVPYAEGLGGSAVEAQACGLPLVATSVGGLTETFVDGETGLSVEQDCTSIAAALVRIFEDEELRHTMGAAARQWCEEMFTMTSQVEATCSFYDDVLRIRQTA